MNKSKSFPIIHGQNIISIKKSISLDNLKLDTKFVFEEFFEGDGPLGIIFNTNKNEEIFIKDIIPNTVASETYGLYKSMILIDIDNKDVSNKTLASINKSIQNKWEKNNRIYLKFKKPIHQDIYTSLLNNNLIQYYDNFIELGASSKEDFEFVIYDDLIKMNMNKEEINYFKSINPNI